ncbi:MAG: NAD(P)-dependent oxidoreductase [Acinetobacter sp.]|nr:NAD(P)-dependent oxidoreductase [Acinetobacter sp.]
MRVLLTGGSGFLGRYILQALDQLGIETWVMGREKPVFHPPLNFNFIEVDLLTAIDLQAYLKDIQPSHLIHLAWYAEHGKYWTSELNLRWVDASVRLVEAFCAADGKQFIGAGTCAEYDWAWGCCKEDDTPRTPATLYGVAKDAAYRLIQAVCGLYGVTCTWARIFIPYGTGETAMRLVPSLFSAFQGKRDGFGINALAYRDFLHASDVAQAFITLLNANAAGAYNISSNQPLQLKEIVTVIASMCHADAQKILSLETVRHNEPPILIGNNSKIKTLGWSQRISIQDGLEFYFEKN